MIGGLTIEKANYNISYMLASIYVLAQAGGRMSRKSFISSMSSLMGCSPFAAGGKENRVPYNKTKFDRYFGFIDVDANSNDLLLTPRGNRISTLMAIDTKSTDPDKKFDFASSRQDALRELFLDSICFDAFGSFNCGAEESNSDIEPPKVILKLLNDVGPCTKTEIGYALWGLDEGEFNDWDDVVNKVKSNRANVLWDYDAVINRWGRQNFVDDFKMLDLLTYEKLGLVEYSNTRSTYSLANNLNAEQRMRIGSLSPFLAPIHLYLRGCCYDEHQKRTWIRDSVLGRVACDGYLYYCDAEADSAAVIEDKLASALVSAYHHRRCGVFVDKETKKKHWNSVVSFVVEHVETQQALDSVLMTISSALERKNDFLAADHGWSQSVAHVPSLYSKIYKVLPSVSAFGTGNIRLPSNFNIIGVC